MKNIRQQRLIWAQRGWLVRPHRHCGPLLQLALLTRMNSTVTYYCHKKVIMFCSGIKRKTLSPTVNIVVETRASQCCWISHDFPAKQSQCKTAIFLAISCFITGGTAHLAFEWMKCWCYHRIKKIIWTMVNETSELLYTCRLLQVNISSLLIYFQHVFNRFSVASGRASVYDDVTELIKCV